MTDIFIGHQIIKSDDEISSLVTEFDFKIFILFFGNSRGVCCQRSV